MNKNSIIGVIGGAGVAATNKFSELLENKYTNNGAFLDAHHPEMIIFQATQVPSRSLYLEGKGESFIPGYINIAEKLKHIEVSKICMVCNTAHYAIDEIESKVGIKFINMVKETVLKVKKLNKKNIGLIASDGCLKGKVYERYIEQLLPDINIIYPDKKIQNEVTRGIINIKNNYRFNNLNDKNRPKNIFTNVCEHLYRKGAELIILGCTDIRVDFEPNDYNKVLIVDSLEILVDKIFEITNSYMLLRIVKE